MIILDFGSGNTCNNDYKYINKMLSELKKVDSGKHEIIIKWQLFQNAGSNIPLNVNMFQHAYYEARDLGYKTAVSVFGRWSLNKIAAGYDLEFLKIANNRKLDYLIDLIPRQFPVIVSVGSHDDKLECKHAYKENITRLQCVSKYPAKIEDYDIREGDYVSDHTVGLDLYKKFKPQIWEKHYKLEDSTGLDAGDFAITPEELKEII